MRLLTAAGIGTAAAAFAAVLWIGLQAAGFMEARGSASDADFGAKVRGYLLENPEILVEALERYQAQQEVSQTDEIGQIVAELSQEIFDDPATPVGGNPEGDVSLVEFFDYNCPYCRRVASTLVEIEKSDPGLRLVYKEWPILGPASEFAARAALASRNQNKYVELHRAMMLDSGRLSESRVLEIATTLGLDIDRLKQDMDAPEITEAIERNRELARALRITGTPSFVIGDEMLAGAADATVIRGLIDQARDE